MNAPVLPHYAFMNASLLAQAPATIPAAPWTPDQGWEDMRNYLEQRLLGMRNWRTSWWTHWAELAANMMPRRYHWLITPNQMTRGAPINQNVVDSTPAQAIDVCAAGMQNGLSNPNGRWFKLRVGIKGYKPDAAGRHWLSTVQERVYEVLAGSNFYDSNFQMYEDQIVFGNGPVIIYEDREDIVRFYNPVHGEFFIATGSDYRRDTLYREFVLTVQQIVMMFGAKKIKGTPPGDLWGNKGSNLETEFIIGHAIEPNFPASRYGERTAKLGVVPGPFAYREYYWLRGISSPQPLSVRGFNERPFIAPPWTQRSNDPYGRSAGMNALPDVKQLNQMVLRHAEAVDKGVRPPQLAHVALKNEPSSILPGRVTYTTDVNQGMKPIYMVDPRYVEFLQNQIGILQKRIETWFYNDVFMMISQMEGVQPRNELEITERRGEKLMRLGPVIEKNINEGLAPLLNRVIGIMNRRGLIPPKPASLRGLPIEVKFVSILALVQQASRTAGMERTLALSGKMEPVWPGTVDNINPDNFLRDYGENLDFPEDDWRDEQEVMQLRHSRAVAQNQAAQAQHLSELAPAASHAADAAQSLSQTDTGGGLLAAMLQGQGAPAGAGP